MTLLILLMCCAIFAQISADCSKGGYYRDSRIIDNDDELIFAETLCRHADRNIEASYPSDPYASVKKYWPEGYGQLTNIGKQQSYKLGGYFRKRYRDLFGDFSYSVNKTYIQSSNADRVLMTAESCLARLYRPFGKQVWNKDLKWQPVPVHTTPQVDDNLLAMAKRCNYFDYLMLQYMNTSAYMDYFGPKYAALIKFAEEHSGLKLTTVNAIYDLYNTLQVEELRGFRLPKWAKKIMVPGGDFERLALSRFLLYTVTPEMKKLRSGYLLKNILDQATNKSKGTLSPSRKLWMYFGHETTIAGMLDTLGLFDSLQPPYASCVFFELYKGDGEPYMQLFYRKSLTMNYVPPMDIPGCGTKCPLSKFYEIYKDVLPTQDFDDACKLRAGQSLPPGGNPEH